METPDMIPFDRDEVPYSYDITLGDEVYTFRFDYNTVYDFYTVTLYHGDTMVVANEKIVYGERLFSSVYVNSKDFPAVDIYPLDLSGQVDVVNWDTFGTKVFLYIDNGETALA